MAEDEETKSPDKQPKTFFQRLFKKKKFKLEIETDIEDFDEKYPEFQGWETVGFHRGLGREFWQLIIELVTSSLYIVILSFLMPIIKPFPEIDGYQNVANGLFLIIYTAFDVGTNFGVNRFIAEYRMKDTRKMLEYISFF